MRKPAVWFRALALMLVASSCVQSADDRARAASLRARDEASTRESEVVKRVSTPPDPHRILYHATTDLSDSNARRTGATIVGLEQVPPRAEPLTHLDSAPVKQPH